MKMHGGHRLFLLCVALGAGLFVGAANGWGQPLDNIIGGRWTNLGEPMSLVWGIQDIASDNGTPYIAFFEFDDDANVRVSVMKFTKEDGWQYVGEPMFSPCSVAVSLAVYKGTPYVALNDVTNYKYVELDEYEGACGKATVMKYAGEAGWVNVGNPRFSGSYILEEAPSLSIIDGRPFVAYTEVDTVNGCKVTVKRFNGAQWVTVGAPRISEGWLAYFVRLKNSGGVPCVAFYDQLVHWSNPWEWGKIKVMRYDGAVNRWTNIGDTGPVVPRVLENVALAVQDGAYYISYGDPPNNFKTMVKRFFTGLGWLNVGAGGMPDPNAGVNWGNSLASGDGVPVVCYDQAGDVPANDLYHARTWAYLQGQWRRLGNIVPRNDQGCTPSSVMCEDDYSFFVAYPEWIPQQNGEIFMCSSVAMYNKTLPEIDVLSGGSIPSMGRRFFPNTRVGQNAEMTFEIQNLGFKPLTLGEIVIQGANADQFSIGPQPATSISAGNHVFVTVSFTPTSCGWKTALLVIPNNDPNESRYKINLSGAGLQ